MSGKIQNEILYLDLPTKDLLDKFGEGKHIPGSGSAAALSGLLACELIKTVCKLTRRKPEYTSVHNALEFIQTQVETIFKPQLVQLFNNDINAFDQVSKLRKRRDKAENETEKRQLSKQAINKLKEATEIPLEICKTCLSLIEFAFSIFDTGFKSARGDSGVAISNLLSAISGSLFIAFLNLKTARQSKWTIEIRKESEKLAIQYSKRHKEAIKRITNLYSEGLPENYNQINLEF